MSESESSCVKNVFSSGIDAAVVTGTKIPPLQSQVKPVNVLVAKNAGKEFPVSDLLDQSSNDFPGL